MFVASIFLQLPFVMYQKPRRFIPKPPDPFEYSQRSSCISAIPPKLTYGRVEDTVHQEQGNA